MPANVKTDRDEHLWDKAKPLARKKKPAPKNFYAYVMGIYEQMKGEKAMPTILIKAQVRVKPHQRRTATGKVVNVRGHTATRKNPVQEWRHAHGGKIYITTDLVLSGRGITQRGTGKGHARGLNTYIATKAAFEKLKQQHGKFAYRGLDAPGKKRGRASIMDPHERERMMAVAMTIKQQIGGKAAYMLGTKSWGAGKDKDGNYYLQLRIGRNDKGVNAIRITLNAMDTYDIKYQRVHGTKVSLKSEDLDIYADQLLESIESNTGMYTSMGTMGVKKAQVRAHPRRTKTGRITQVREHVTRRVKRPVHGLAKLSANEKKAKVKELAKLSLKELRRRQQDTINKQHESHARWEKASDPTEKEGLIRAAENLNIMERMLTAAIDKKEFGKSITSEGEPMDMQQFPALQKAINRATLSKSLEFNKKGSEIKAKIEEKIVECKGELALMVIEWKAGLRIRSTAGDAECDEAPSTATATEPPEVPWKVRNKRREIEDLERVARNIVEGKTYKISEYELREYGF